MWQGFSTRWYWGDPVNSVFHNPLLRNAVEQTIRLSILTTIIAVPLGVAFAIGINRWRTRTSTAFNFVMVFSYVIPELIFGVAMFFLFTQFFKFVHLGTLAEILGLVTWNFSWPAIIVLARLVSIGSSYEEAAADLGASRLQSIRRVLIPMLMPAIFASAVLVFASVVDDFVVVDLLSSTSNTQPMSVIIYANTHGGNGGPGAERAGHPDAHPVLRGGHRRGHRLPLDDPGRTGQRRPRGHDQHRRHVRDRKTNQSAGGDATGDRRLDVAGRRGRRRGRPVTTL